jgi:prevent-host-death family protein
MKQIALQDAKARFGKVVDESLDQPIVITLNGKKAAILLPAKAGKGAKMVQGRRGVTKFYEVLRAAPGELKPMRLRGKFRPADL